MKQYMFESSLEKKLSSSRVQKSSSNHCPGIVPCKLSHSTITVPTDTGRVLNPRYEVLQVLYESSTGTCRVSLIRDTSDDQLCVLKSIFKSRLYSAYQLESIRREIEINSGLKHPNIVEFFASDETPEAFHILMEYVQRHDYFVNKIEVNNSPYNLKPDGDLLKFRVFSIDILSGLQYLHQNNIVHLDLKPGNLLLNTDVGPTTFPIVKICDFGLSRHLTANGTAFIPKKCGTDKLIPPEVTDDSFVTAAADMWSFGLILHNLAVGYTPYAMKWKPGQRVEFHKRNWRKYEGTGLQELIEACLRLDPRERITAGEALAHKWAQVECKVINV